MNKKRMKPYVGVIALILGALDIFLLSPLVGRRFPVGATFLGEFLLAVIAVLLVLVFRGDLREVFPFQMPDGEKVAGTLIFWMGCFITAIVTVLFVAWLFPQQFAEILQSGGVALGERSLWVEVVMVCVMPAICEEMLFRGVFLNSLSVIKNKWVVIMIVSALFGAFHGSFIRFVSTSILGFGMAYVFYETRNMTYNMLFHMVNNLIPVLLMQALSHMDFLYGLSDVTLTPQFTRIPLMAVGLYMVYGAGAPMFVYVGNYLLHVGQPGYEKGLFPKEKTVTFVAVTASCFGVMLAGMCLMGLSFYVDRSWFGMIGM